MLENEELKRMREFAPRSAIFENIRCVREERERAHSLSLPLTLLHRLAIVGFEIKQTSRKLDK